MAKRPSASSKKLLKDLPTVDEMFSVLSNLKQVGDHATIALMGAAYLENSLEALLATSFQPLDKEDYTRMFDGAQGGILGTFSAKIRLGYAINRIGEYAYHDLLLLNDIRNVFAHSLHQITFDNELVTADCAQFSRPKFDAPPGHYKFDVEIEPTDSALEMYCKTSLRLFLSMQAFALRLRGMDPTILLPVTRDDGPEFSFSYPSPDK